MFVISGVEVHPDEGLVFGERGEERRRRAAGGGGLPPLPPRRAPHRDPPRVVPHPPVVRHPRRHQRAPLPRVTQRHTCTNKFCIFTASFNVLYFLLSTVRDINNYLLTFSIFAIIFIS